ncbi:MAG: hypothetical protein R2939_07045 [Kofleriaceae bacterium]
MTTRWIGGVLVAVAACGGLTEQEGIYDVATWTENPTGCDAEGPSVAAAHAPHVFLRADSFFGQDFINVVECSDLGDCRTRAAETDTLELGGNIFDEGNDDDGWRGRIVSAFGSGGTCGGTVDDGTLTTTATGFRIEHQRRDVTFEASDCTTEAAEAAAAAAPCSSLEVITTTLVESL